jgi:transposase
MVGVLILFSLPARAPAFADDACRCQGCGADVSGVVQSPCETYDRVEIPVITPDVTQVSLYGGVCPCCAKRFKAAPPEGLEPGSPFGPNLRALAIYLRAVQGIPLARLSQVLRDLFGLDISEGALVRNCSKVGASSLYSNS